jgi:hypothetical protein
MLRPSSSCCPLSSLPPSLPSSSSTSNTPDVWSRRSKSSRSQQPSMVTWWASHRRFKEREDMTASSWDLGREGEREGGREGKGGGRSWSSPSASPSFFSSSSTQRRGRSVSFLPSKLPPLPSLLLSPPPFLPPSLPYEHLPRAQARLTTFLILAIIRFELVATDRAGALPLKPVEDAGTEGGREGGREGYRWKRC